MDNEKRFSAPAPPVETPAIITGPDPSLTPEQRYAWTLQRMEDAYRCMDIERRIALLQPVVENPVEDEQLMSAAYATLSNAVLSDKSVCDDAGKFLKGESLEKALAERGARAEQYALKSLELNPANTFAPYSLFMGRISQKHFFDAFEAVAKYNLDMEAELPGGEYLTEERKLEAHMSQMLMCATADHILEEECKESEKFDRYFELHARYRESFHFTERLLMAAIQNPELSSSAKAVLCDDFARYETIEAVGAEHHFVNMVNLLYMFCIVNDNLAMKKCLAEVDALYPVCRGELTQIQCIAYYGNRMCTLNYLGRYEEVLAMAPDIGSEYRDNTVLYHLMRACIKLERYTPAVKYGRAAVSLGGDEMDMMGLGQAYLGKKDYAKAVEALKTSIWYIKRSDGKETYDFADTKIEKKNGDNKEDLYLDAFKLLIQAYVGLGQYVEAEAAYQELCQLVPESGKLSELRLMLTAQRDLIEKSGDVEKQCRRLKKELIASRNVVDDYVQRMRKWADKLVRCQLLTDEEITDEMWESSVRGKMDEVLRVVCESEMAVSGKFHDKKLREVKKRFPRLSKPLQSNLATAEQLYTCFKGNTAIDFAPVLVEYCKVVEGALWEYLLRSADYQEQCRQWLDDSRGQKTLGSGCAIVSTGLEKPLYRFEQDLRKLKKLRNDSAHVGVDRVPDVEWVRTYLWQGDLLDALTEA